MSFLLKRRPFAASAVVVLASLALVELSLRGLGFGHPLLYRASASGYEVAPDQSLSRLFKTVKYNSYGLRNDPVAREPAEGGRRILCLGDSITYGGSQVDNSGTYPEKLRALLPGAEVLNASAGGWSVVNELKWLVDHGTFGSHAIVLEVGENDLFQPFVDASLLDRHPSFPTRPPTFATAEVVTRYVLPRLGLGQPVADPGAAGSRLDPEAARETLDAVEQIHHYATAHGAGLTILYIDPAEPSDDPQVVAARDRLFAWADRASVPLVRPELGKRRSPDRKLFFDALHPDAAGNEIIAEELAKVLSRRS